MAGEAQCPGFQVLDGTVADTDAPGLEGVFCWCGDRRQLQMKFALRSGVAVYGEKGQRVEDRQVDNMHIIGET